MSMSNTYAEVYFRTMWHLHPFSCLATTDISKKICWGWLCRSLYE